VTTAVGAMLAGTRMPPADALQQPIELDLFEGPFDLLLTLVLRDEVELLELPLIEVVTAALGEDARERWDTDTAGELIVLLAAMAELKARRLLGEPGEEEPDPDTLEAREALAARIVAYAPFQRAAAWLGERGRECVGPRYRRVPIPGAPPPPPADEDAGRLRAAMLDLLKAPPAPSLGHLTSRRVSMPQALQRLKDALARARSVSFEAVTAGFGPLEEAIALMAALELARRGEVTLSQAEPFGDIAIRAARAT
jgi:segregation and condensation protein A